MARFVARTREVSFDQAAEEFDMNQLLEAASLVSYWRELHAKPLSRVSANLRYYLAEPPGPVVVAQRLKRRPTMVDKLIREPTMDLTQMADIGGCRAILPDQDGVTTVGRRLRQNWTLVRTRDYVAKPKPSGYRAIHHIVRRNGRLIEVQLRTPLQDVWANQVERDSRRVGVGFKSGVGSQRVHEFYLGVSELFALREAGHEPEVGFMAHLRDLYGAAQPYLNEEEQT